MHNAEPAYPTVLRRVLAVAVLLLACSQVLSASAAMPTPAPTGEPAYAFPYKNPFYATVVGYVGTKKPDLKLQSYKLHLDTFKKKEFEVKALLRPGAAPLVVVLPGIEGRGEGPVSALWASWLAADGNHVMTFDATLTPGFIKASGHGVSGNMQAEAERIGDLIQAFRSQKELNGRITKIGIVGMSYGGVQVLLLGKMAQEGRLPFKLDALQVYSPPIDFARTGELIDRWYREDRWNYTLVQLATTLGTHKPVGPEVPVPFTDTMMRAGLAAAFRLGLARVVLCNNTVYDLKLFPCGPEDNPDDYAALWGYSQFTSDMAYPYWQPRLKLRSLDDFTAPWSVPVLLRTQPPASETIIAADDPFNTPGDTAKLKAESDHLPVTILPNGGHLGYVREAWTKWKLLSLFARAADGK